MRERPAIFCNLLCLALGSASVAQATVTSAQCQIQAYDGFSQPASGVEVTLALLTPATGEDPNQPSDVRATGTTGANGSIYLEVSSSYGEYKRAACFTNSVPGGYAPYLNELFLSTAVDNSTLSGQLSVVPRRTKSLTLAGGGMADLYQSGGYDKPIVVAQPFNSAENLKPFTWSDVWIQYNGDPTRRGSELLAAAGRLHQPLHRAGMHRHGVVLPAV